MNKTYFAVDGNYGDAVGLAVIDTSSWTDSDWELVDSASDSERPAVAKAIVERDLEQLRLFDLEI